MATVFSASPDAQQGIATELQRLLAPLFASAYPSGAIPAGVTPANLAGIIGGSDSLRISQLMDAIAASRGGRGPSGTSQVIGSAAQGAATGAVIGGVPGALVGGGAGLVGGLAGASGGKSAKKASKRRRRQARAFASPEFLAKTVAGQIPLTRQRAVEQGKFAQSDYGIEKALAQSGLRGSGLEELAKLAAGAAPETGAIFDAISRAAGIQEAAIKDRLSQPAQGQSSTQAILEALGSALATYAASRPATQPPTATQPPKPLSPQPTFYP